MWVAGGVHNVGSKKYAWLWSKGRSGRRQAMCSLDSRGGMHVHGVGNSRCTQWAVCLCICIVWVTGCKGGLVVAAVCICMAYVGVIKCALHMVSILYDWFLLMFQLSNATSFLVFGGLLLYSHMFSNSNVQSLLCYTVCHVPSVILSQLLRWAQLLIFYTICLMYHSLLFLARYIIVYLVILLQLLSLSFLTSPTPFLQTLTDYGLWWPTDVIQFTKLLQCSKACFQWLKLDYIQD